MKSENGKTILLVEDQFLIAMSEKSALEKFGYAIVVANSGEKAIELAARAEATIDLILMDIDLRRRHRRHPSGRGDPAGT